MADEEILPAVSDETSQELTIPEPATLFRTDDPVEIIARATEVAKALSDVLKAQSLTSRIKDKDYVKVEGWTLCGTMLGVFPVVEWTRERENGWEARVEARTKDGATVGAAEAECLRSESKWASADDYAIRSMAQTRAISKALRAPLGFIVSLAGYEATPAEEMFFLEDTKAFDPEKDLLKGAMSGRDAPRVIAGALQELEPTVDWQALLNDVVEIHYGVEEGWRNLPSTEQKDFWRRLSNATFMMQEKSPPGSMPPIDDAEVIESVAFAFSGLTLESVPHEYPDVEDIPFGE